MMAIERLAARLPEVPFTELEQLLFDADGMLLAYTGRSALPKALETARVQLAAVLYNLQGTEGETAHSEGGVSRTMEGLPEDIRRQVAPYRLARIGCTQSSEPYTRSEEGVWGP